MSPNSSLIIKNPSGNFRNRFIGRYKQLLIYGLVGLALNLLLYCAYLIFVILGTDPKASMTLVYAAGVAIGFYSHKRITFSFTGNMGKPLIRFIIAHSFGYLINLSLLFIFVDFFEFPHQLIQALSTLVVAFYLFIIFKFWVFFEIKHHATT